MSEKRKRAVQFKVPNRNPESTGPHIKDGMFHEWGNELIECSINGCINITVGIVEDPEGNIYQVIPINLKFK